MPAFLGTKRILGPAGSSAGGQAAPGYQFLLVKTRSSGVTRLALNVRLDSAGKTQVKVK